MQPKSKYLSLLALLLLLASVSACGQKGAKLQKSVVPPDKTLFETGQEYLDKSQFIKGRLAFQTLINTYPDSDLAAESYLAIGDSFYDEGGGENLLQAEDQFKNFIIFFPTHPKASDAQLKIIALNMKLMKPPDRDQSNTYKAEAAIRKFLEQFPDSEYAPTVKRYLIEVQEHLAQAEFGVGSFYLENRKNYTAANARFRELVDKYPDFSLLDEAYFKFASALELSENTDEAAIYYGRIVQGYPFSRHFEEAKTKLEGMGKPVPAVDTALASLNQQKQKTPEGFSPLKPIVDFGKALGFIGPPDRYETAKKDVEAKKADTAAQQAGEAAGTQAGEDTLINATLSKSATGDTQTRATLGANSNGSKATTDKNGDKKSQSDKNKKKNSKAP